MRHAETPPTDRGGHLAPARREPRRQAAHPWSLRARTASGSAAGSAQPLDVARAGDHLDRLYRVARGLTGSAEEAEDLVQETYARVLARPRLVRAEAAFGYLVTALRNTFIEGRRSRRPPLLSLDELAVEPVARSGRGHLESELAARELYRTIADLPQAHRDVLAAVDLAGLSYREAADVLDVPVGTVMSRVYRARAQLVARLGTPAT